METRTCRMCQTEQPIEHFSWKIKAKGLRQTVCQSCANTMAREYRRSRPEIIKAKNKERYEENKAELLLQKKEYYQKNREVLIAKQRERDRKGKLTGHTQHIAKKATVKRLFGITLEDVARMADEQGHVCAICHQSKKIVIDHDHKTGKIRGLLCRACNAYIGAIQESPETLRRAIAYIENGGFLPPS